MKIQNIGTPLVLGYYYSKDDIDNIISLFKEGFYNETNGKLYLTVDYNTLLEESLRLYKSKTEKITPGNEYVYEYENDVDEIKDDKVFIFHTEEGKFYKCELDASYIDMNPIQGTIVIVFDIIK